MRYGASAQRNGARRNGIRAIDVAPPEGLPDREGDDVLFRPDRAPAPVARPGLRREQVRLLRRLRGARRGDCKEPIMTDTKGGKGLHGPDKRQDALRDEGS